MTSVDFETEQRVQDLYEAWRRVLADCSMTPDEKVLESIRIRDRISFLESERFVEWCEGFEVLADLARAER